ncbi:hypothetical protein SAMN04490186_3911 [Pseudomonas grimontii]|uniref:Uncharacterized protein n=1 Tax=Pseudomonas grimontii TaxID=129847 RepID=A0A1H1H1N9_9PSED|nr:hypothetical protein [Pseudomonas grimontii]TWR52344.1 hypothetical protein FIV39_32385 [Pseudomonas grimontii]SDR19432.1 hypothetical protein SAMN04490186_3911 [Pseudomonas grimontii]
MSMCFAITDADWALTKDAFSILGTIISAVGVVLAARIGFLGLATWRKQNRGTSDHELSRRVLIDLYRLRDRIRQIRNPAMLITENLYESDGSKKANFEQINFKYTAEFYQIQFSVIDEVRSRLETSILESEAVWGYELKRLVKPILNLQHEIFTKVISYLGSVNPNETEDRVRSHRNVLSSGRNSLYESHIDGEDEFNIEMNAALSNIEDYLRPMLI